MEELTREQIEIASLFKGTFQTEIGKKCIERLKEVFVERDIYTPGMTLDQVAFRQGEASVIKKIIAEIDR